MGSALVYDGILEDPTRARRIWADGRMHVGRQSPADLLEVFDDARTRPIEVCSILEDDINIGIPEHGLRTHGFNVRRGQQARHDRIGDLILNDVRWLPIPARM